MWGVDNTLLSRAIDAEVFEPYAADGLDALARRAHGARARRRGDAGRLRRRVRQLRHRRARRRRARRRRRRSRDLAEPEYASRLVVENPATSSPGLAFLMATIAEFGDGWEAVLGRPARQRRAGRRRLDRGLLRGVLAGGRRPPAGRELRLEPAVRGAVRRPSRSTPPRPASSRRRASARSSSPACCAAPTHADAAQQLVDFLISERVPARGARSTCSCSRSTPTSSSTRCSPSSPRSPTTPLTLDPADDRRQPGRLDRPVDRDRHRLTRRDPATGCRRGVVAAVTLAAGRVPRACSTSGRSPRCSAAALRPATRSPTRSASARTWEVLWFTSWQAVVSTARHARRRRCRRPGRSPASRSPGGACSARRAHRGVRAADGRGRRGVHGAAPRRARPQRAGRSSAPTWCSTSPSSCARSVRPGHRSPTTSSMPRPRSAPRRGGRSATVTLPLLRPAIACCRRHRVPVHVHVVRRRPGARWRRPGDDRGRGVAAGDPARRHRRARRRWPCCSSSCSASRCSRRSASSAADGRSSGSRRRRRPAPPPTARSPAAARRRRRGGDRCSWSPPRWSRSSSGRCGSGDGYSLSGMADARTAPRCARARPRRRPGGGARRVRSPPPCWATLFAVAIGGAARAWRSTRSAAAAGCSTPA